MTISNDNAFVIQNYVEDERGVFGLNALRGMPPAIRRQFLEAIILAVSWETTVVAAGSTYTVTIDDVVILAGSAGATATKCIAPAITDGRVLVFKDTDGNASNNGIEIHVKDSATEKIDDGASTTFNLNSDYGAVVLVADNVASKWYTIAIV